MSPNCLKLNYLLIDFKNFGNWNFTLLLVEQHFCLLLQTTPSLAPSSTFLRLQSVLFVWFHFFLNQATLSSAAKRLCHSRIGTLWWSGGCSWKSCYAAVACSCRKMLCRVYLHFFFDSKISLFLFLFFWYLGKLYILQTYILFCCSIFCSVLKLWAERNILIQYVCAFVVVVVVSFLCLSCQMGHKLF